MTDENMNNLPQLPKLKSKPMEFCEELPPILENQVEKSGVGIRVVGVRFSEMGRVYNFNANEIELLRDDPVVVDVEERGLIFGWISETPTYVNLDHVKSRLRHVVRKATADDIERKKVQEKNEAVGFEKVHKAVNKMNLPMDVIRVEYSLDLRNAIVYFAAENRVDFRELLKELIHDLKARVELRQVGVRDQTGMEGCVGPCGEEICCSRFIKKFHGVSIKMAKDQELSLKPARVSGMCGRLKCCLAYEHQCYREALQSVPRRGRYVVYQGKKAIVQDVDILRHRVTVITEEGSSFTVNSSELQESNAPVPQEIKQKLNAALYSAADEDDEGIVSDDAD